jgi:hypothetical protein
MRRLLVVTLIAGIVALVRRPRERRHLAWP